MGAYRHLMYCAQSQFTAYHALNWLFLVVPPNMWGIHSLDAYPTAPANPGLAPRYGNVDSPLAIINAKDTYNIGNKNFQEDANMNRALLHAAPQPRPPRRLDDDEWSL